MGSGFKVQGSGLKVRGSWLKVQGSGLKVRGSGLKVRGSVFRGQCRYLPEVQFPFLFGCPWTTSDLYASPENILSYS